MLAISVREALRDAVAAFHPNPEHAGPVDLPLPATCEAIFLAARTTAAGRPTHPHTIDVASTETHAVAAA